MRKKSLFASILACLSLTLCACHESKAGFEAWDASFTNWSWIIPLSVSVCLPMMACFTAWQVKVK